MISNLFPATQRNRRHLLLAAIAATQLLAGLAQTPSLAQSQPTSQPATRPTREMTGVIEKNGKMTLNFQDASIDVILDELSSAAGFVVVKEVKPQGRVSLVSRQPISPEESINLLNTVLRNAGYTAIQQDRILKIVASDAAKRLNIPVRTGSDPTKIANTDELITQVIPLKYSDATQLKTDLQPLINSDADFTANASSNALVITDTSANVRRVVQIVADLDTSVADSIDVKVFQLKFASATDAAALINSVFGTLDSSRPQGSNPNAAEGGRGGGGGGGFGGGGFGGGGGGGGRGGFQALMQQAAGASKRAKITAAADTRTNSVVVTGPTDALLNVENVIKQLDSNPAAQQTVFVYRLKNAQALNLEAVLNALFNGTTITGRTQVSNADRLTAARANNSITGSSSSSGSSSPGGGSQTTSRGGSRTGGTSGSTGGTTSGGTSRLSANGQQTVAELADQVSIIAETDTNSIVVRTAPANWERVKSVLEELDHPLQQVLIKVLLAEVTHDVTQDIGAELSAINLRTSGNGQSAGTGFNIPTGPNATGMVVQLLETNFTATIRALETEGKLDVLSRPYILASDNQLASITVGQEVPFITRSQISDTGQVNNTIEYSDIGILLDVIPHINPDGIVILDVAPEISTLTNSTVQISETVTSPIINKRSAQSRVAVRSGETVVIGGLMQDKITKDVSKVPLLGDIPYVGELFKRTTTDRTKTELLIFLTPHVAADPSVLPAMGDNEVKGTKLLPNAVGPGVYEEHRKGLESGEPPQPATRPTFVTPIPDDMTPANTDPNIVTPTPRQPMP